MCGHCGVCMCMCECVHVQWRRKFAKSGGAILLVRKYLYCKNLKSYGAPLKSGGAVAP